jgi:hypothetical protein
MIFWILLLSPLSHANTVDRLNCAVTIKDAKSHFKNTHTVEFQSPRMGRFESPIHYFQSESKSRSKIMGDLFQFGFSYNIQSVHALLGNQARHKICTSYRVDICKNGFCQEELFSCGEMGNPFGEGSDWAGVDLKNGVPGFSSTQLPRSLSGSFRYQNEIAGSYLLVCEYIGSTFLGIN